MKSMVLIATVTLIFTLSAALSFAGEPLPGQVISAYGSSGVDEAVSVANSLEGGFLLCGKTRDPNGYYDALIIRVDSEGKPVWWKKIGGAGDDEPSVMIPAGNGSYIIAGYTQSVPGAWIGAWMLKIRDTGEIAWQKYVAKAQARALCLAGDGNYFIAGRGKWENEEPEYPWLMKIAPNGSVLWQKVLSETWSGYWRGGISAVAPLEDAGCIAVMDERICRFDKDGCLVWIKAFDKRVGVVSGIARVPGKGILVSSGFWPENLLARITLISDDGDVIWCRSSGTSFTFTQILARPDGKYLVLRDIFENSGILFIDDEGNLVGPAIDFKFPYEEGPADQVNHYGTIAPDGNAAFVTTMDFGSSSIGYKNEMALVKTGEGNAVSGGCSDSEETVIAWDVRELESSALYQESQDWSASSIDASAYVTENRGNFSLHVGSLCPVIDKVNILRNPFRLEILGGNLTIGFYNEVEVTINGVPVPVTTCKSPSRIIAKKDDALKAMLPKGETVCLEVQCYMGSINNRDLWRSGCYEFKR